jgi:hypothetical protein
MRQQYRFGQRRPGARPRPHGRCHQAAAQPVIGPGLICIHGEYGRRGLLGGPDQRQDPQLVGAPPQRSQRGFAAAMLLQQQVQVVEVAQQLVRVALLHQVDRAVDHPVGRAKREHARTGLLQGRHELGRVHVAARHRRVDGVVQVDRGVAAHMRHRRHLVHPFAVVALVVG